MLVCFYLLTTTSFIMATTLSTILLAPTFFFYKEFRNIVLFIIVIKSNYSAVESHNNKIREGKCRTRTKEATDYLSEHIDNIEEQII